MPRQGKTIKREEKTRPAKTTTITRESKTREGKTKQSKARKTSSLLKKEGQLQDNHKSKTKDNAR
jgi:hypothetical protein